MGLDMGWMIGSHVRIARMIPIQVLRVRASDGVDVRGRSGSRRAGLRLEPSSSDTGPALHGSSGTLRALIRAFSWTAGASVVGGRRSNGRRDGRLGGMARFGCLAVSAETRRFR